MENTLRIENTLILRNSEVLNSENDKTPQDGESKK